MPTGHRLNFTSLLSLKRSCFSHPHLCLAGPHSSLLSPASLLWLDPTARFLVATHPFPQFPTTLCRAAIQIRACHFLCSYCPWDKKTKPEHAPHGPVHQGLRPHPHVLRDPAPQPAFKPGNSPAPSLRASAHACWVCSEHSFLFYLQN